MPLEVLPTKRKYDADTFRFALSFIPAGVAVPSKTALVTVKGTKRQIKQWLSKQVDDLFVAVDSER